MPVGNLVTKGGMAAVSAYYERLGPEFVRALHDMLVFDAVICNVDRHFGNFGFLIDNKTNRISAQAPLFDHGNSLFNFTGTSCWEDPEAWTPISTRWSPASTTTLSAQPRRSWARNTGKCCGIC